MRDDFRIRCSRAAGTGARVVAPDRRCCRSTTTGCAGRWSSPPPRTATASSQRRPRRGDGDARVEDARAALPLLAFAVARLWEQRDCEHASSRAQAYDDIGGVAGALAQHADEAPRALGTAREPLVRELFRNLVTAQGTRAVVDRDELLSAFSDRAAAEAVFGELVEARLLTSDEVEEATGAPTTTAIEIAHESLLSRRGRAWCAGGRRTRTARTCATS